MTLDDELHELAASQHAAVSREQLRLLGFTADMVRHRLARGRLLRVTPNVYMVAGAPLTDAAQAMSGVLDAGPGAVLSHTASIAFWDLPGFELTPIHALQPRGGLHRRSSATRIHSVRLIPSHHIAVLDGVPVTTPTRALFDLAGMSSVHPDKVARTLDTAWARRLTSGPILHDMLDELKGRGRNGVGVMREILSTRDRGYVPPESSLEARFHWLLKEDGQEPMARQANVGGVTWLARVDAYDWEARVIAQIQSNRFHTALLDRHHDDQQTAALVALGFVVEEIWEHDVWYHGRDVQRRMRNARARGRQRWMGQPWAALPTLAA